MSFDWDDDPAIAVESAPPLPFVTGSRAYGKPRDDSDLDLVMQVDDDTFDALLDFAGKTSGVVGSSSASAENVVALGKRSVSLRFGDLNLILVNNSAAFEAWRDGTKALKRGRPVTRDRAKAYLSTLFTARGAR